MQLCSSCENFAIHNCIHRSKENHKHFSGLVGLLKTCGAGNLTIKDFRKDMLDVKLKKSMKSSLCNFTPIKSLETGIASGRQCQPHLWVILFSDGV